MPAIVDMPVILSLRRLRQEDHEIKVSLAYVRSLMSDYTAILYIKTLSKGRKGNRKVEEKEAKEEEREGD